MIRKKFLVLGVLFLGVLGLIGCGATGNEAEETHEDTVEVIEENGNEGEEKETDSSGSSSEVEPQYTTSVNQELIDAHNERYEEIIEEFQTSDYTLEEPLVVQDPYGRSPLSALVLFETDTPMETTVTIKGKDEYTTISHTFSGYETVHEVAVLGLYPDMTNEVILTGETEDGMVAEVTLNIETNPLPNDILDLKVVESQPEKMEDGLTFLSPSKGLPLGVDSNGDIRWYSSKSSYNHFKRLENGNVLMTTQESGRDNHDHLNEMDMTGRIHQSITVDMENVLMSPPLHHDVIILPNNNYLALLHDGSDEYVEDEIAELDRETGEVVHRINLKDVFPNEVYTEYEGAQSDVGDWIHVNAVWKLEDEDAILLSSRHQDMILKLSYPEADIEWILAAPEKWPEELEDYVLESIDEDLKYPAAQHAVMEMPDQDGDDSTLDIMLFDNNLVITRGNAEVSEDYSRAVQYRIDQEENTVEEIWSYGEERGTGYFTDIVSDADFFPQTENVLITAGRTLDEEAEERYSIMTEATKTEDPEVVYELHYGPFGVDEYEQIYRSERLPLYPNQ